MKNSNPIDFFLGTSKEKQPRFEGFGDIDGDIDNIWHEAMKKYVAEILWNPNHPDRNPQTTKGGQGSGNFGHGGLSGVWGGSSSTVTKPAPPKDWQTLPKRTTPNLSEIKDPERRARAEVVAKKMGKFTDFSHESGYNIQTDSITFQDEIDTLTYEGRIFDKDGKSIGNISLDYHPDINTGHISYIRLQRESRKTGFGRNYTNHIENVFFNEMKVSKITLLAAMDVGGYFWARAGYDFSFDNGKRNAVNWLKKEWTYRYNNDVPSNILKNLNHTWDIASLVGPDGFRIGKQTMLGCSWDGEKKPDGIGRQVGLEYYNAGNS